MLEHGPVAPSIEGTHAQIGIVIPTRNAKSDWQRLVSGIRQQHFPPSQVVVIDSESEDGTAELARAEGFQVHGIRRRDFNHGATRQLGVTLLPWAKILVFLTQDAVLATPSAISELLTAFTDDTVAAAYGRQLPRHGATAIEAHARLFNYPATSEVRDLESRSRLGIKATFLSNSFSAFRVNALCDVGGFPTDVIMAEDALAAARLLLAGWKIAYVAEAAVYHSHPLSIRDEFRRYFDIGVYYTRERWLSDHFGKPGGEGMRYVLSELRYLAARDPLSIPQAWIRTALKAVAYKLGVREATLGQKWSRRLSLHKGYWD